MRVLVLGAYGFIGSHLIDALQDDPAFEGTGLVRSSSKRPEWMRATNIQEFDMTNTEALSSVTEEHDVVVNAVSSLHPRSGWDGPALDMALDELSCLSKYYRHAAENTTAHQIFISSGGALYQRATRRKNREHDALRPLGLYGASKLFQENLLQFLYRGKNQSYNILRVGNAYGPHQPYRPGFGVIPHMVHCALTGRVMRIFNDGNAVRDYIYIDDLVDAFRSIMLAADARNKIFNVGTGKGVTVRGLLSVFEQAYGRKIQKEFINSPTTGGDYSVLMTKHLVNLTGWIPKISLEEGMKRVVEQHFVSDIKSSGHRDA